MATYTGRLYHAAVIDHGRHQCIGSHCAHHHSAAIRRNQLPIFRQSIHYTFINLQIN